MTARAARCVALAAAAGLVATCLPADDRPVPGSVLVMAEPSEATKHGFTSSDDWEVKFDRVLLALGDVDLDDAVEDSGLCTAYSETHYEKLFDFVQVEREKVGLVYGLGDCSMEYRFRGPGEDALLGSGASEADAREMEVRSSDAYSDGERISLRVQGSLSRDGVTKRFDWSFRRGFEVSGCTTEDGEALSAVSLEGEAEHTLIIEVRAEELFRRAGNDDALLMGGLVAVADENDDGEVDSAELQGSLGVPAEVDTLPLEGVAEEDMPAERPENKLAFMYDHLLPRVTRMRGGAACEAEVRGRR